MAPKSKNINIFDAAVNGEKKPRERLTRARARATGISLPNTFGVATPPDIRRGTQRRVQEPSQTPPSPPSSPPPGPPDPPSSPPSFGSPSPSSPLARKRVGVMSFIRESINSWLSPRKDSTASSIMPPLVVLDLSNGRRSSPSLPSASSPQAAPAPSPAKRTQSKPTFAQITNGDIPAYRPSPIATRESIGIRKRMEVFRKIHEQRQREQELTPTEDAKVGQKRKNVQVMEESHKQPTIPTKALEKPRDEQRKIAEKKKRKEPEHNPLYGRTFSAPNPDSISSDDETVSEIVTPTPNRISTVQAENPSSSLLTGLVLAETGPASDSSLSPDSKAMAKQDSDSSEDRPYGRSFRVPGYSDDSRSIIDEPAPNNTNNNTIVKPLATQNKPVAQWTYEDFDRYVKQTYAFDPVQLAEEIPHLQQGRLPSCLYQAFDAMQEVSKVMYRQLRREEFDERCRIEQECAEFQEQCVRQVNEATQGIRQEWEDLQKKRAEIKGLYNAETLAANVQHDNSVVENQFEYPYASSPFAPSKYSIEDDSPQAIQQRTNQLLQQESPRYIQQETPQVSQHQSPQVFQQDTLQSYQSQSSQVSQQESSQIIQQKLAQSINDRNGWSHTNEDLQTPSWEEIHLATSMVNNKSGHTHTKGVNVVWAENVVHDHDTPGPNEPNKIQLQQPKSALKGSQLESFERKKSEATRYTPKQPSRLREVSETEKKKQAQAKYLKEANDIEEEIRQSLMDPMEQNDFSNEKRLCSPPPPGSAAFVSSPTPAPRSSRLSAAAAASSNKQYTAPASPTFGVENDKVDTADISEDKTTKTKVTKTSPLYIMIDGHKRYTKRKFEILEQEDYRNMPMVEVPSGSDSSRITYRTVLGDIEMPRKVPRLRAAFDIHTTVSLGG